MGVAAQQHLRIPEADVADRLAVGLQGRGREVALQGVRRLRDSRQVEAGPGGGDVARYERALFGELVGVDDQRLVDGGHHAEEDYQGHDPGADGDGWPQPAAAAKRVVDQRRAQQPGDAHEHPDQRQADIDVGRPGAEDHAGRGIEQAPGFQEVARASDYEDDAQQCRKMTDGAALYLHAEVLAHAICDVSRTRWRATLAGERGRSALLRSNAAEDQVQRKGHQQAHHQRPEDERGDVLQGRHGEHVERDVVVEDRVLGAK